MCVAVVRLIFALASCSCVKELYFGHLQELRFGNSTRVARSMMQEFLVRCVSLAGIGTPYIYPRDVVKPSVKGRAMRPWGCLRLQHLVVYIAKQEGDEPG